MKPPQGGKERGLRHAEKDQHLPWKTVDEIYPGPAQAILDKIAAKPAKNIAKGMQPQEFEWYIAWERAEDPEGIRDVKAFTSYLIANSRYWLRCHTGQKGGRIVLREELSVPPQQVVDQFERYAKGVCAKRQRQPQEHVTSVNRLVAEIHQNHDDDTDLEATGLLAALEDWLEDHPDHNKQWASVARTALEELMK